jgi:aerobic C4-dicarboxylate transport protein
MSEARALTNFAGNAIATVLIGTWVGEIDKAKASLVLAGGLPFDEAAMIDDDVSPAAPVTTQAEPELVGAAR